MSEIQWVTPDQVAAAKLVLRLDEEDGLEPDPLALKIANATPMRRPKPANRAHQCTCTCPVHGSRSAG
jgi:hypothetical protein